MEPGRHELALSLFHTTLTSEKSEALSLKPYRTSFARGPPDTYQQGTRVFRLKQSTTFTGTVMRLGSRNEISLLFIGSKGNS